MTETTTTEPAAAAKDAEVLNGVTTTPAKPGRTRQTKAQKEAAAKAKAEADAKAEAAKAKAVTGPQIWATKEVTGAMANFTAWIAREYPDLKVDAKPGSRDARLVMIASKAYRYFQSSDLNK